MQTYTVGSPKRNIPRHHKLK